MQYLPEQAFNYCAFDPDGRRILAGTWHGALHLFQVSSPDEILRAGSAGGERLPGWSPQMGSGTTFSVEAGRSGSVILTPWLGRWCGRFPWARIRFRCPHCLRWSSVPLYTLLKTDRCQACARSIWLNHFFIRGNWRSVAKTRRNQD